MMLALPLLLAVVAADPRPAIVELAREGQVGPALAAVEHELAERSERARTLGLDYLRGDLLERAGRPEEAIVAFAAALGSSSLSPWARHRLAQAHAAAGHPERAAQQAVALLAGRPPPSLVRPALELLRGSLSLGGDCGLLATLERERLRAEERRLFDLTRAECRVWQGRAEEGRKLARALLEQNTEDDLAHEAARLLARLEPAEPDRETSRWLGLTAYSHREFDAAIPWLARAIDPRGPWNEARWEVEFALARGEFWLGRHSESARRFRDLAATAKARDRRAAALYQAARSHELAGAPSEALDAFLGAHRGDPEGEWAAPALSGMLRLELLSGNLAAARGRLTQLATRRAWQSALARSALFLVASQVVQGRPEGVRESLDWAERTRAVAVEEVRYWRGRSAELEADLEAAAGWYVDAVERGAHQPFAQMALRRLERPELARRAAAQVASRAAAGEPAELWRAARILGAAQPDGAAATRRGLALLRSRPSTAPWIDWRPVPAPDWPLWRASPAGPEDLLLGLGHFEEAPAAVRRHFPLDRIELAFTGAARLAERGAWRRSLLRVETLFERRPAAVPWDWVSAELRRLLYPLPYASTLAAAAQREGVDPLLLAALIREESRFDAGAISPASARGLAQFILPTARRIGKALGWQELEARDLLRPDVSITLGAAYLGELSVRFRGREEVMLAAYNAGEAQAELWLRYCFSQEPEEYLSKIGFRETRAYVQRVLQSRSHYQELENAEPR